MAPSSRTSDRRISIRIRVVALAALCWLAGPPGPSALAQLPRLDAQKADLVVVRKSKRILQLIREGRPFKTYPIALGPEPEGAKRMSGDGRTPEGVYTLDWRNPNSNFYRASHIS